MSASLGIDLGTSGVKVVLADETGRVVDQETVALTVSRPHRLWSEQDPESWWSATDKAARALKARNAKVMATVAGIGLSGHMHGATLLGVDDKVLRPCILWNDGRSGAECAELEKLVPRSRAITGNIAMPGFTAPKLLWVKHHEPEIFAAVRSVLLPKDYLRLKLAGEKASDMSDSAGTLWMDTGARRWSGEMVAATGLDISTMPRLVEGSEQAGTLRAEVAEAWGIGKGAVIAGGAGDNAAGAIGAGVIEPGQAMLSLGTSGVIFAVSDGFRPNAARAVHAFCHCLPGLWHQMSVMLSAAACVDWAARLIGLSGAAELVKLVEEEAPDPSNVIFLPYLSGERTPHNNPNATGVFFGMTHETGRAELARAVLEGVALGLADGIAALREAGTQIARLSVIGGGARSKAWGRILASALDVVIDYRRDADVGPALGAARLGRLAATGERVQEVALPAPLEESLMPDGKLISLYAERQVQFRELYKALAPRFAAAQAS